MTAPGAGFTCPVCARATDHPIDVKEGYCPGCHWPTGVPEQLTAWLAPGDPDRQWTVQLARDSDLGGVVLAGLSMAQRSGHTCLICNLGDSPQLMRTVGQIMGHDVVVHTRHVERWRMGQYEPPVRRIQ